MKTYYERIEYNMAVTVTIINKLTKVIGAGEGRPTFISPSGVTVPCTPIQEYISDMVTIDDGTLYIPAYNKGFQDIKIPYGAQIKFEVEDPREINYWQYMFVEGATIYVDGGEGDATGVIEPVEQYTYTKVTFSGTGTEEDPYVPAFAEDTYYKVESDEYVLVANATGWGTEEVYTRTENVPPVNGATPTEG